MIDVLEFVFEPLPGTKELGRMKAVPTPVPLYDAIRGGYYILSPFPSGKVKPFTGLGTGDLGLAMGEGSAACPVEDWMMNLNREAVNHALFASYRDSSLATFDTITFIKSVPQTVSGLFRMLEENYDKLIFVKGGAVYEDLVQLALSRLASHWDTEMVRKLLRRTARGTNHGDFVQWNELRTVLYTMKPELHGTLKSWDDFNRLDLSSVFKPSDFDRKDDIVIACAMSDSLMAYDAFVDTFTTPGVYDDTHMFLHWAYKNPVPAKNRGPYPDWMVQFSDKTAAWALDCSGPKAGLEPAGKLSLKTLRSQMTKLGMPPMTALPYRITWEELDRLFYMITPGAANKGVTIAAADVEIPVFSFDRILPIGELDKTVLQHTLSEFQIKVKKEKQIEALCDLLESLYPGFEAAMNAAIKEPLIRVNVSCPKDTPALKSVFWHGAGGLVIDYLMAFYMCLHMRGKVILDPSYTSEMYTKQGIFKELVAHGYPPPGASFASGDKDEKGRHKAPDALVFACPFGPPSMLSWQQGQAPAAAPVAAAPKPDLQVESVDELLGGMLI